MLTSGARTTAAILFFTAVGCRFEATLPDDPSTSGAHAAAGAPSHAAEGGRAAPKPQAAGDEEAETPSHGGHPVAGAPAAEGGKGAHGAAAGSGAGEQPAGAEGGFDPDDEAANDTPAPSGRGVVPEEIIGAWYTSSGHTSIPVDPDTGSFGTPNGNSLLYQFNPDGTYQKAFQSSASNGGCTTGFNAIESGTLQADGHALRLTPAEGRIRYADNCAPSLDSDKPIDDLTVENFTWQMTADGLQLTRDDGASSVFVRVEE